MRAGRGTERLHIANKLNRKTMTGIALLGAGRMARVHAKAIVAAGGKLVTVFDVIKPAAASLAAESNASVSGSAEEASDYALPIRGKL